MTHQHCIDLVHCFLLSAFIKYDFPSIYNIVLNDRRTKRLVSWALLMHLFANGFGVDKRVRNKRVIQKVLRRTKESYLKHG